MDDDIHLQTKIFRHGINMDYEGNVYGAGYSCISQPEIVNADGSTTTPDADCDCFVAKFSAVDG